MDHTTALLMIKALDGLAARAVVTAENIANAGTANYRPLRLSFEAALKEAALRGDDAAIQETAPKVERTIGGTPEAELRPDLEMATASATALRYSALIDMLNRQVQLAGLAMTGSR
jgi:flagellar basal-body rod protein FlgB